MKRFADRDPRAALLLTAIAVGAGAVTTLVGIFLVRDSLGRVPVGAEIRPMGLALFLGMLTLGSFAAGLLFGSMAFACCASIRRWGLGLLLAVVSIAPNFLVWPVTQRSMETIVAAKHLRFAP